MTDRDLDVVVFGATGVTGRRVAAYLAERAAETPLRWAAAGRDAARVTQVLSEVGVSAPVVLVADIGDASSLTAMAARTRVLLNLVGPYTTYGRPVVEACLAAGCHYVDLTGEVQFAREVIDEFNGPAVEAGIKLVQICGFEAMPPDLMVALAAARAREHWGEELGAVDLEVTITPPPGLPHPSDAVSGGTFQSAAAIIASEDSASVTDPGALITDAGVAAAVRRTSPIMLGARRGAGRAVIAPMAPAPFINPAVIHRTAALAASGDGRAAMPFRYREGIVIDGGAASLPLRWAIAGALSATQVGLRGLAHASPTLRRPLAGVIARVGPSSGFGPAADRLEGWHWAMWVHARTTAGNELDVHLQGDGHPGYLATARLLGETGMLLAEDGATPARGGALTPAAALGTACIERFERAHLRFSVGGLSAAADAAGTRSGR